MTVKAYKVLARADIEFKNVAVMVIFEVYLNKDALIDENYTNLLAYFTKQNKEIVFKVTKNQEEDSEEFIHWKEYMKYRLATVDRNHVKNINQLGNYLPYNDTFENLLKQNNIHLEEGEDLQLRVFGYDLITPLNEKELTFHQFISNNFQ